MYRTVVTLGYAIFVIGLLTTDSYGQLDGLYRFDAGGDGTSWDDATNWEQVLDPFGTPISGDPAAPPSATTSAAIPLLGVVIDATMPGQTALDTHVGITDGAGSISINGGGLTARDFNVGSDAAGTNGGMLEVSGGMLEAGDDLSVGNGSQGIMTMSSGLVTVGDDFFIDSVADMNSSVSLTGGTIHVIDRLVMGNHGSLHVDGAEIIADDDFYILDNGTVTIDSGLMSTFDKLNMGDATPAGPARLTINGGIMRSNEWTDNPDLEADDPSRIMSFIEINGTGKLQVEQAFFPIAEAQGLIASGRLTTSELSPLKLGAQTVVIPAYFGRTDVVFTQISVVPEPTTWLLAVVGGVLLARRRRK